MSSEQEEGAATGREHANETSNAERAGRDAGERGAASRHGGERGDRGDRGDRGRRGRRGGGGHAPQQSQRPPQQQRRGDSSLNMDELRELTELFTTHGLTDFEFENADIRVRLSRNTAPPAAHAVAPPPPTFQHPATALSQTVAHAAPPPPATAPPATEAAPVEEPAEDLHIISSPIVGTFYRSPSPEAEAFVRVGTAVEQDTVVCIIEAMKLMNEIHAETNGTVEKIYVENGQPVEYGQPLFGVKK